MGVTSPPSPHITMRSAVSSEVGLLAGWGDGPAGLQLPLLTSSESSPGCGSDPAQCDPHAFSCHLTPPQKLARQGFPLSLTDEETDVPRV